jgi:hypothetical protein
MTMSKTQAKILARPMMRLGWYDTGSAANTGHTGWMTCTRCRERVSTAWLAWEKPGPALFAAMVDHLANWCEAPGIGQGSLTL